MPNAEYVARLEAENERHQRANLLRAVLDGYERIDKFITDAINADEFDRVPWLVADSLVKKNETLRAALDEAQLRSIEARNPGIDMDEVRRTRAAHIDGSGAPK